MAFPKPGQQFSLDDIRRELALGAGPVALNDPRIRAILERSLTQDQPVSLNSFDNRATYRPPASLQFNTARASQYLVRNCPAGANPQRYTYNCWVKQLSLQSNNYVMAAYSAVGNYDNIGFTNTGAVECYAYVSSAFRWRMNTIKTFPINQWHNLHLTADISNAAIARRVNLWVNGEFQASAMLSIDTQPTVNNNGYMNNAGILNYIGIYGSTPYADMRVGDQIMLDNVVIGPENFGEYIGGVWMPKKFDITKYNRGPASFHLDFANATDVTSAMINLSTGRAPILNSTTDWRVYGVWNTITDVTADRPRFGGAA